MFVEKITVKTRIKHPEPTVTEAFVANETGREKHLNILLILLLLLISSVRTCNMSHTKKIAEQAPNQTLVL